MSILTQLVVKILLIITLMISTSCQLNSRNLSSEKPNPADIKKAKELAIETAKWFEYTTGKMNSAKLGQCSDYALKFALNYNKYAGKNIAKLVVANNPIESGIYSIGEKVDVAALGFDGFQSGASGILIWADQIYLYHPIIGAYELFLERAWTPKKHFGVKMLDKRQVHVWATVGDLSVDPTYYDLWPESFPSPLGKDE